MPGLMKRARTVRFLLLLPVLLAACAALAEGTADARIGGWIRDLGSPVFAAREAATRELKASGVAARPHLEKALASKDVEVRCRAEEILWEIERLEKVGRIGWLGGDLAQQLLEQNATMGDFDLSKRLRLGVVMLEVMPDLAGRLKIEGGVLCGRVQPGSAAERGGLKSWDLVTQFNGVALRSSAELQQAVREAPLGKPVRIEFRRLVEEGKAMAIDVVLDDPSPEEAALQVQPAVLPGMQIQIVPVQEIQPVKDE